MTLLITNARIQGAEGVFEILLDDVGRISEIDRGVRGEGAVRIDAKGGLVLPTFIEPHVHLDKALLSLKLKEAGSISEARQMVRDEKKNFTRSIVRENAERIIHWAIGSGVTAIRTHIDVDRFAETKSVEAMIELREKYRHVLVIQIVAFPQEGLIKDRETKEYLDKALDLGADVLGGMPEAEITTDDSRRHIDLLFSMAKEREIDLDVHCDVLPGFRNIEYLASKVLQDRSFVGRVAADHLIALSYYDTDYAKKIIQLISETSINVVCNPCTMISSGATPKPPSARGITLVKELIQANVNVSYGSDNVVDPYNPFGDMNPLSNGFLLAYGARMNSLKDFDTILRMATHNASKILRLSGYGLEVGCNADLNIFSEKTPRDMIRSHSRPAFVIKRGRVILENRSEVLRHY